MDDVGLQVRHLVREEAVNISWIFQVVPCELGQPQGFVDICESRFDLTPANIFHHC